MHQATLDLQKAMQKMKKSYREYYILKMDVRKFFNSIDKKILYKILKEKRLIILRIQNWQNSDARILGSYIRIIS